MNRTEISLSVQISLISIFKAFAVFLAPDDPRKRTANDLEPCSSKMMSNLAMPWPQLTHTLPNRRHIEVRQWRPKIPRKLRKKYQSWFVGFAVKTHSDKRNLKKNLLEANNNGALWGLPLSISPHVSSVHMWPFILLQHNAIISDGWQWDGSTCRGNGNFPTFDDSC